MELRFFENRVHDRVEIASAEERTGLDGDHHLRIGRKLVQVVLMKDVLRKTTSGWAMGES